MMQKDQSVKLNIQSSFLLILCLVLSLLDRMIPLSFLIPIPGIRIGLANIVIMYALVRVGRIRAALISLARIILVFLFSGNVTAMLISFGGAFLSFIIMALLCAPNQNKISIFGISVLGASLHNIGQLIASSLFVSSSVVFYYLPFMLLTAVVSGLITALPVALLLKRSDISVDYNYI